MSTRELIALFSGLAVAIAVGYALAIEPKSWEGVLLAFPIIIVGFAVLWILERREVGQ